MKRAGLAPVVDAATLAQIRTGPHGVALGPNSALHTVRPRKKSDDWEHREQVKLFEWIGASLTRYPDLEVAYAVGNWIGVRTARQGARLKAEGRRAGVPDICLPVARGGWHGLYIEMKRPGEKPTPVQQSWHQKLIRQYYRVVTLYGYDLARLELETYLALDRT